MVYDHEKEEENETWPGLLKGRDRYPTLTVLHMRQGQT